MLLKTLKKSIDKYKIISFDIFDTLLLRPFIKPSDLFLYIEQTYNIAGYYNARSNAEQKFYQQNKNNKETTIDDIYSIIPQFLDIKQKELDLEFSTIHVNAEIKEAYDYAVSKNKRIIITSDMYLPKKFIEELLLKNGITKYENLYLSNELQKRKDRGDLYKYIITTLNIKPSNILHIGDNKYSDYKQAKKFGIKAYLYKKPSSILLKRDKKFNRLYKNNTNLDCSIITALCSEYTHNNYWTDFGYKYAAPIVFAYAKFIYDTCIKENIKQVLFTARDGYILNKIFNIFNKNIKTNYVYAPRILNYTTNLDYDNNSQEQAKIICEYFGKKPKDNNYNNFIQQNLDLFKSLANNEKINADYSSYIKNIVTEKNIAIVDTISKQLSSQKLIEQEAQVKTKGFYLLTFKYNNLGKYNRINFFSKEQIDSLIRKNKQNLLELIFSAPCNPIITLNKQKPVYQDVKNYSEQIRHTIYNKIEQGVMLFINDIQKYFNINNLNFTNKTICDLITAYVDNPTKKDFTEMLNVKVPPFADNKEYVPLFCEDVPFWNVFKTKKLIWHTPAQKIFLSICLMIKKCIFYLK